MSSESQNTEMNNRRSTSRRRGKLTKKKLFVIFVLLIALGGAAYLGNQYQEAKKEITRLSNPQEAAREEVLDITQKVGNLVQLPENETPTIATVSDVSKLSAQPFFVNAVNGDKVLIFTQARKAVLYRPSTNKIIEVAPINIGQKEQ
ncbi:MAG: hypothetical protein M3P98_01965 [bacterium]|nr:hypothetical protein [bacterium]